MNPRFKKLFLKTIRALAILMGLFVMGTVALGIFRTDALEFLAKRYLQDLGLEDVQFTMTAVQLDSLVVDDLRIDTPDGRLALDRIEVEFKLAELLQEQRIQSLTLTKAEVTLRSLPNSNNSSLGETAQPTIADIAKRLDLSAYLPLPFDRIQIIDSKITVPLNQPSFTTSIEAELNIEKRNTLSIEARLTRPTESLDIEARISSPEQSSFAATLKLATPVASLNEALPNWQETLPQLKTIHSGPLEARLAFSPQKRETPEITIELAQQDLVLEYAEGTARIPNLSATSTFSSWDHIPIILTLAPEQLSYDTLAIMPDLPTEFRIEIIDQSVVKFQTQSPVGWNYDSGFAQAQSDLKLSYDLSNEENPLQANISTTHFLLENTSIDPFTLTIEGTQQTLSFRTSDLSSSDYPQASIAPGSGTIEIPEDETAPITLSFASTLSPSPIHPSLFTLHPSPFSLSLITQVFEASSQSSIELSSHANKTLASLPGIAELAGQLRIKSNIIQDSTTDRYSGDLTLDASNISIQSNTLTGNGIALQAKTTFRDIASEMLTTDKATNGEFLSELLERTTTSIDWQANHLRTQDIEAQWSGGSLALNSNHNQILVTSAFGAGIVTANQLKLEQVYAENEHRGTLENLAGTSIVSALLDGSPIELSSQQRLTNLLADLSLTGEYTLAPISFQHSDLPGRFAPELAGLSFSADTQAKGRFYANLDTADASLSLKLRDGSLAYPAAQLNASGLEVDLELDSLTQLDSGEARSRISILNIDAGDAHASDAHSQFRIRHGERLAIDTAQITFFDGQAKLQSIDLPLDGSDFQGELSLEGISLDAIARYIEIFDGRMEGHVSGYLPFRMHAGQFELLRGELTLPDDTPATLRYQTKGLLTHEADSLPATKRTFSERLLKFLKVDPDATAEQALGNITVTDFQAELFPEDSPETPIRVRIAGIAHSDLADIPVVITTQVHGSLSELYNFLIRLNSL